jgi:hypothetical protein
VISTAETSLEAAASGVEGNEECTAGVSSQDLEQCAGASGQIGMVPTAAIITAVEQLCQGLPSYKTARLQEAYMQAVGPENVEYSWLEALLQPLICMPDLAAQATLVQRHLRAAARAARAEELLYVDVEPDEQSLALEAKLATMRRSPSPAKMHATAGTYCEHTSQPDVTIAEVLNHEFVAAVLELFLEQQVDGLATLDKHVNSLSLNEGNEPATHSLDLTPQERDILGANVPASQLLEQLVMSGTPPITANHHLVNIMLSATTSHSPFTLQVSHSLVTALQLGSQRVWFGLALSKLKAQLSEGRTLNYLALLAPPS